MTRSLSIRLAVPGAPSYTGNWVTARRWAGILGDLGHKVEIVGEAEPERPSTTPDLLVALHADKTFSSIESFHRDHRERPLIVTLTGTDLYRDVARSSNARRALRWADRLIVLQPLAFDELGAELRQKARLIRQSCLPAPAEERSAEFFDVCVVGHLREVKDPFRAAEASRLLPAESKIRVLQAGAALSEEMEHRARQAERENPRYRWLGELRRDETLRLLARSRVLAHTSRLEGGANVMSEALVTGLPVVSSRVAGSVGMLGDEHPAYFEAGDSAGLARVLRRCETDTEFLSDLARRSHALAPLYSPEKEVAAWQSLLAELMD